MICHTPANRASHTAFTHIHMPHGVCSLPLTLTLTHLDAYVLGGLIALFERAVGLYGSLVDVNAYHQPGVEAGKRAARDILTLSRRIRAQATPIPIGLDALARAVDADPIEVWHVCERLVATRHLVRETDDPPTWRQARGHER